MDNEKQQGVVISSKNGETMTAHPRDFTREIRSVVERENIGHEEAWDRVKQDLQLFLDTGNIPKKWGAASPVALAAPSSPDLFTETSQTADLLVHDAPQPVAVLPAVQPAAAPPASTPVRQAISDELLPANLRNNVNVIEAMSKGLFALPDEHPDAELLRRAATESAVHGDEVDGPAMRAVRERQLLLPFKHPMNVRIMPSDFNQTSLFHVASNNTPRRHYKNEPMGKIGDKVDITFYGEELRHDDEANFLQLLHLARGRAPFEWIYAMNVPFIRESRGATRITSSKDSEGIDSSLMRMRGAYLVVRNRNREGRKKGSYITVNLIKDLQGTGSARRIMIDPCIVALLDSYSAMDGDVLYKSRGIVRQLYKYISTTPHVGLYPIKVMSLFELCYGTLDSVTAHYKLMNPTKTEKEVKVAMGKKTSDFRRKNLPNALAEMKDDGLIIDYKIDEKEDKVAIVKPPLAIEHVT